MSDLFKIGDVPMKFMSIKEFCKEVGISVPHFYALEKAGKAPRTISIGLGAVLHKCRRITRSDALKWVETMQKIADAERKALSEE